MKTTQVTPARVRFAPSPTGLTHLGSVRTALYNYLLARQTGGQFILRIEDTDQKRYDPESEQDILDSLKWLGLDWDEGPDIGGPCGPYRQSERKEIYQTHAQKLIERGHAYACFCSPQRLSEMRQEQQKRKEQPHYDRLCRQLDSNEAADRVAKGESYVIRFKTPTEGRITVNDHLRGDITVENKSIDDYILVKSDGFALYHLAVVVDDHLMDVTHVFRGEEWLPTFPLHVHIYNAFGWNQPIWVHPSVFLNPSGKGKMSKRFAAEMKLKGTSIFVGDLMKIGYLPEAVINWIALMGWSYDDHTEFFTLSDLIEKFDLDRLNPKPAAINFTKFDHFAGLHMRDLSLDDLAIRLEPFFDDAGYEVDSEKLAKIVPIIQERIITLEDAPQIAGFFFQDKISPDADELVGKNMTPGESIDALLGAFEVLKDLDQISATSAEEPMRALAEQLDLKAGQLFGILRVAVTGQNVSPPLFESMEIIGKDTVLERLQKAIQLLGELSE